MSEQGEGYEGAVMEGAYPRALRLAYRRVRAAAASPMLDVLAAIGREGLSEDEGIAQTVAIADAREEMQEATREYERRLQEFRREREIASMRYDDDRDRFAF